MDTLVKNVSIADYRSSFYKKNVSLTVNNNIITSITVIESNEGNNVEASTVTKIYPGFIDVLSFVGEPGFEQHETINNAKAAAKAGGYTKLFTSPFVAPQADSAAAVLAIKQLYHLHTAPFNTMGSINKSSNKNQLADMLDMHLQGVQLFTIKATQITDDNLLLKAMEFITAIKATLVIIPSTFQLFPYAQMHEGIQAAGLGLAATPSFAEQLVVEKIILFCKYTMAKVHIAGVSSAATLPLIAHAKTLGLPITASTSPMHLLYTDGALTSYDTNFKTNPPLRTQADRLALIEGLQNGTLDSVLTHHQPHNADEKDGEFDKAAFGISSLETCFYMLTKAIPNITDRQICNWLSLNNATLTYTTAPVIEIGNKADFTIIKKEPHIIKSWHSKSKNNPEFGNTFDYKIL